MAYFDYSKLKGFGRPNKKQKKNYQDFDNQLNKTPNEENEDDRSFFEKMAEFDDPQKALGQGISSYHQQLHHLIILFVILWLLHMPILGIYNSYSFYDA